MNAHIIASDQDLIKEIIVRIRSAHLSDADRDYSLTMVVFPGRRPSHFLRKAMAEEIKTSFIPPVVYSMDEFIDSVYEEFQQGRRLETVDAAAILYDIHLKAPDRIGGDGFMTPDRFFPIGLKIYRDIEELTIEGINPHFVKEIESIIAEGLPEQTQKRLQSLSYFYQEFYKEIEKSGFSTRSLRYRVASETVSEAGIRRFRQVIFAGFFGLTKAEKTLFGKLLQSDNFCFIFQEGTGIGETIKDLGLSIPGHDAGKNMGPELHFYSSPDTHGQVFALAGMLQENMDEKRTMDAKTVIVLPASETLFPLLRQGLAVLPEDSFNISLGYPLHRTPVFGFLNNLMELVTSMDRGRVYIPDYLKFVLHPYTKNIYMDGRAETTRILFHTIEEELTENRARTFISLSEIEENGKVLDNVLKKISHDEKVVTKEHIKEHLKNIHGNTIGRMLAFENIRDFAMKCTGVLVYIFNNSTARLHPLFHPFSESFIESLDLLPRSLMKDIAFEEISSYFAFFRKYVMTCHTPFAGTPIKGLQVLGFLETRNLQFDRVFILDANEEILPDTKKEDSLLPFRARQILGLPTYIDRDRLTSYYFDTLLKGSREAHIFFIENNRKERSRFVEKLIWERQKTDGTTDEKPYIQSVQYKVNLVNKPPETVAKTAAMAGFLKDYAYNATALNQYLKCQLQFYYSTVMRLGRKEEITGGIVRTDLGNFVHAVLRKYFSVRKGRPLKETDMNAGEMEVLVDELFSKEYGEEPSGAVYLLKRQVRRHLSDLVKDYYIPLVHEENVVILENEEALSVRIEGYNLKGRIDSVEQRGDKTVIVDYKTGSSPNYLKIDPSKLVPGRRETWNKAIGSIQLPFYILLYSVKKGVKIKDLNAMFLLLGRSKISREIELPLFTGPADDTYELLKDVIFRLLKEISDPGVPFTPAADMKKTCPSCEFTYICGTQWIVK
jgi:CRISPR/Cas system-associated exonuclease Cas4 (RecB family)